MATTHCPEDMVDDTWSPATSDMAKVYLKAIKDTPHKEKKLRQEFSDFYTHHPECLF